MKLNYLRHLSSIFLLIVMSFLVVQNAQAQPQPAQRVLYSTLQQNVVPGQSITLEETWLNTSNQPIQWQPKNALRTVWQTNIDQHITHAVVNNPDQTYILQPGAFQTIKRTIHLPESMAPGAATARIENAPGLLAVNIESAQGNAANRQLPPTATQPTPSHVATSTQLKVAPTSAFDAFRNAISSYEPVYFDVGGRDGANARFQISFKYRLFSPASEASPGWYNHLYLGYTQTSLWDLAGRSKPFVDTTYNPAVFWHNPLMWESGNRNWAAGLATGLSHRSNGKSGVDSRSLNEAFIQPEFNYRFTEGSQLSFQPKFKTYFNKHENPDYADYLGYVDWKLRWAQPNGWVVTGLYQQGKHGRATTQLEVAWPLKRTFLNMNGYAHIQYFRGYGQTLLNYRQKSEPQIRFGLALVP